MSKGRFGVHGGQYIPETLMNAVIELEEAYNLYKNDPEFNRELQELLNEYAGRPSRLYFAKRMTEDLGGSLAALKVDGGASANNFLMQFQSDVLGCEVKRPQCIETTSLGAAYLAGLATGYWKSKEDVLENWQVARVFTPQMQEAQKSKLLAGWKKAVACVRGWAKDEA